MHYALQWRDPVGRVVDYCQYVGSLPSAGSTVHGIPLGIE